MPHPLFSGSKRQAKLQARDARRVRALQTRLNKIYGYARLLKSEEELDRYLEAIPDDAVRAETRKLIEPFCLFPIVKRRVVLADAPLTEGPQIVHHQMPGTH